MLEYIYTDINENYMNINFNRTLLLGAIAKTSRKVMKMVVQVV